HSCANSSPFWHRPITDSMAYHSGSGRVAESSRQCRNQAQAATIGSMCARRLSSRGVVLLRIVEGEAMDVTDIKYRSISATSYRCSMFRHLYHFHWFGISFVIDSSRHPQHSRQVARVVQLPAPLHGFAPDGRLEPLHQCLYFCSMPFVIIFDI